MSQAEFPTEPGSNAVVRWFQIIPGTVILLTIATLVYAILLAISDLIPPSTLDRFPFGTGELLRVLVAASIGTWTGAACLKFVFPRVGRRPVFLIIALIMGVAILGGSFAMAVKGTSDGWQGVVSAIVFLIITAIYVSSDAWDELPGRKSG